jgi:hypothetical protein
LNSQQSDPQAAGYLYLLIQTTVVKVIVTELLTTVPRTQGSRTPHRTAPLLGSGPAPVLSTGRAAPHRVHPLFYPAAQDGRDVHQGAALVCACVRGKQNRYIGSAGFRPRPKPTLGSGFGHAALSPLGFDRSRSPAPCRSASFAVRSQDRRGVSFFGRWWSCG